MNNQEKNTYVRNQILRALLNMMQEQPFADISISALVSTAQVGRASFYRNFTDKEDVLRQENDRLTAQWKQSYDTAEHAAPNELLISLLDFYKEHSDFCLALYQAGLSDIVLQTLLKQSEITPEMPNAIAYLKSSIAYMLYGWIVEWMKRGMQESGTELAKMFEEAQGSLKPGLRSIRRQHRPVPANKTGATTA